jgi:hypothetical protein
MKTASVTVFEVIAKDLQGNSNSSFHMDYELNKFFGTIGLNWKRKAESESQNSNVDKPFAFPLSMFGF